jgi:hypothetical protein
MKQDLAALAALARESRVPIMRVETGTRTLTERQAFLATRDPLERRGAMTEREHEARAQRKVAQERVRRLDKSADLRAWYRRGLRFDYLSPMKELELSAIELRAYQAGRVKARKRFA